VVPTRGELLAIRRGLPSGVRALKKELSFSFFPPTEELSPHFCKGSSRSGSLSPFLTLYGPEWAPSPPYPGAKEGGLGLTASSLTIRLALMTKNVIST